MKVDPGNGVNFLIMRTFQTLFILLALCGCGRRQPAPETVRPVKVVTASGAGVIDKDFAGMLGDRKIPITVEELEAAVGR